jgi:hypothetical protein
MTIETVGVGVPASSLIAPVVCRRAFHARLRPMMPTLRATRRVRPVSGFLASQHAPSALLIDWPVASSCISIIVGRSGEDLLVGNRVITLGMRALRNLPVPTRQIARLDHWS